MTAFDVAERLAPRPLWSRSAGPDFESTSRVAGSQDEAELHITTWRQHYPGLTYSDVEYMRRETFTGPWVADHG